MKGPSSRPNRKRSASAVGVWALIAIIAVVGACGDGDDASVMPEWVEEVYPEPGATVAVPDAVEVDHTLQTVDEDIRLVIDGTDVTAYATFEAGKIRYESGDGPVILGGRRHTAEVQRVELEAFGEDYEVLDSYTWEFRTA